MRIPTEPPPEDRSLKSHALRLWLCEQVMAGLLEAEIAAALGIEVHRAAYALTALGLRGRQ